MQHTTRQPGIEGTETHANVLAEQLVVYPGQPVGIALQTVEELRIKQQRRATQLVLNKDHRHGLNVRELLHRFVKLVAQPLCAPTRYPSKVAEHL